MYFGIEGNTSTDQPWWAYDETGHAMQVRMIRLYRSGGNVFLEQRWHPERGRSAVEIGTLARVGMPEITTMWKLRKALDDATHLGGSPEGWRKGDPWPRDRCLGWWKSWIELDGKPTQKRLAKDMGVSVTTAITRWRVGAGLRWPPTDEELEEEEAAW